METDITRYLQTWSAVGKDDGFVAFVKSRHLVGALQRLDWRAFAHGYNGPSYYRDNYHGKIAKKYRDLAHTAAVAAR